MTERNTPWFGPGGGGGRATPNILRSRPMRLADWCRGRAGGWRTKMTGLRRRRRSCHLPLRQAPRLPQSGSTRAAKSLQALRHWQSARRRRPPPQHHAARKGWCHRHVPKHDAATTVWRRPACALRQPEILGPTAAGHHVDEPLTRTRPAPHHCPDKRRLCSRRQRSTWRCFSSEGSYCRASPNHVQSCVQGIWRSQPRC